MSIAENIAAVRSRIAAAAEIGYPVLVRPSFVLGGRAMQIVANEDQLRHYLRTAVEIDEDKPVLVDKYIQGREVEIVKLHGNIELAPLTGMAERIVDITATGTTLAENDLVVVEEVLSSTARFFANACAFRTDERIVQLAQALAQAVQAAPQAQDDPAPQAPAKQG